MSVFNGFPDLPRPGEIAFCVVNGKYCCANSDYGNVEMFTNAIKCHPQINVTRDQPHPRASDEGISMYLEVEDNLLKRITSVWYKQGFLEALHVAADPTINRDKPLLALAATYALKMGGAMTKIQHLLQPHLKDIGPKIIAKYSRTRNWTTSPIRCMAWHPHTGKLAVASSDDVIRVAGCDGAPTTLGRWRAQSAVAALAWRPLAAGELAVACEDHILLWTLDPNGLASKPNPHNALILKRAGHRPVTSVCWAPEGDVLASCSAADGALLLWDVASGAAQPLRRVAGGGLVFAAYSPDGAKLFTASTSTVFRVWDTERWRCERWCVRGGGAGAGSGGGRAAAAAWLPARTSPPALIFAATGDDTLYALHTHTQLYTAGATGKAQGVAEVGRAQVGGEVAGGAVLDVQCDPRGAHLALVFHESPLVAVFAVDMVLQLQLTPCCLINGMGEEFPSAIAWQQNFEEGACLTIGWSSGRLQHFPIVYTDTY